MAGGGKLKGLTDIEFKSYSLEYIYFLFACDVTVRKQTRNIILNFELSKLLPELVNYL